MLRRRSGPRSPGARTPARSCARPRLHGSKANCRSTVTAAHQAVRIDHGRRCQRAIAEAIHRLHRLGLDHLLNALPQPHSPAVPPPWPGRPPPGTASRQRTRRAAGRCGSRGRSSEPHAPQHEQGSGTSRSRAEPLPAHNPTHPEHHAKSPTERRLIAKAIRDSCGHVDRVSALCHNLQPQWGKSGALSKLCPSLHHILSNFIAELVYYPVIKAWLVTELCKNRGDH